MSATLYAIPGSHAVRTGELMLEAKGVEFRRVNLPVGPHRVIVRVKGFRGDRVPAVVFENGRRAQGTRELPRVLDELDPGPPQLVPPSARALEAEEWADAELQQWARRVAATAGVRDPDALTNRGASGRLGPLLARNDRARRAIGRLVLLAFRVDDERVRRDREETGAMLDHIDALIADGVLAGEELHAADYAVASSLALVDYVVELRPELRRRPLYALLERVLPESDALSSPAAAGDRA